jgi:hypothetical protein
MVGFMLYGNCQEIVGDQLKSHAGSVQRSYSHRLSAFDLFRYVRERKAALPPHVLSVTFDNLWIDKNSQLAWLIFGRDINYEDSEWNTNLGRGKANSRGRIHRLGHVINDRPN